MTSQPPNLRRKSEANKFSKLHICVVIYIAVKRFIQKFKKIERVKKKGKKSFV